MNITIKQERRVSRKIIVGRLNRHFPFLRPFINKIRFLTFPDGCSTYPNSMAVYTDGPWIDRKVTKDQQAIEAYLRENVRSGERILHVGIGSSSVAKNFSSSCIVDGITVVNGEKTYADSLELANYTTYVMNKNNIPALNTLAGEYDYIVDNDLAAYACCKQHFLDMLRTYRSLLAENGKILVGAISVNYFDSGFPVPLGYLQKAATIYDLEYEHRGEFIILHSRQPISHFSSNT